MPGYATVATLTAQLRGLGLRAGGVTIVHSSYKSLGYVVGGPQAVVQALLDAAGPDGTIVVPTHTSDNSDPSEWSNPPVPSAWWDAIRNDGPGFDTARTPAGNYLGRLAELVRTWPGALRSNHPQVSFAAVGAQATEIVDGHSLTDALGEASPIGAVYRLNGQILLLGCGHGQNTSLHLAETRLTDPPMHQAGGSVRSADGTARWVTWPEVDVDASDFDRIGSDFEKTGAVRVGPVGGATARLMSQRAAVEFAHEWLEAWR